jgi:hypothetical protein
MSIAIAWLMAGFLLLSGLVLFLLLKTRLAVAYKLMAIAALTLFYWAQYLALHRYAGWPVREPLPEEFVLIASEVIEPNHASGEPGRMYWWVRESAHPGRPPRVYELPYVQKVHQQSAEVLQAQQGGGQYIGHQAGNGRGTEDLGIRFEHISKSELHRKQ